MSNSSLAPRSTARVATDAGLGRLDPSALHTLSPADASSDSSGRRSSGCLMAQISSRSSLTPIHRAMRLSSLLQRVQYPLRANENELVREKSSIEVDGAMVLRVRAHACRTSSCSSGTTRSSSGVPQPTILDLVSQRHILDPSRYIVTGCRSLASVVVTRVGRHEPCWARHRRERCPHRRR